MIGLLVFIGFAALVVGAIGLFKFILDKSGNDIKENGAPIEERTSVKLKYDDVNINKYRPIIMNVGLILSLAITWTVFNWNFADGGNLMDLGTPPSNQEEAIDIPQTVQAEPPPPKQIVQDPEIVEVEDDVELEDEVEIETEVEVPDVSDIVTDVVSATPGVVKKEEKEDSNEIFDIVEEAATPVGGMEAFYEYVSKEIKYPKQAKRMQVQGKVFVVFVVEKDGSLTQVEVLKGIGAGCDEEALRVIKNAPKWNPAKQRGRAVRTRIRVPITFRLRS